MRGLLIFNYLNDIVYINCCSKFAEHVENLASSQSMEFCPSSDKSNKNRRRNSIDTNILIQLFSPLVTSQRFMREQFGNPYSSVQCEDGTNIVFQDYNGFLFLRIGNEDIEFLRRSLGVSITLITFTTGPDISLLKSSAFHTEMMDGLLATWSNLYECDTSFLLEAVEQILISGQTRSLLIKSLQQIANKIGSSHVHTLLFMETKLLSWYSTRGSKHLTSEDILCLIILSQYSWPTVESIQKIKMNEREKRRNERRETESMISTSSELDSISDGEKVLKNSISKQDFGELLEKFTGQKLRDEDFVNYLILLKSETLFIPHQVHIGQLDKGFYFVLLIESPNTLLASTLCSSLQISIEFHSSHRDITKDKQYLSILEQSYKKILDLMKKSKNTQYRNELILRFEKFKSGFQNYLITKDPITLQILLLSDIYREAFRAIFNYSTIQAPKSFEAIWKKIKSGKDDIYFGFLNTKEKMMDISGQSHSIKKYLEEYPGLVHFIYIDRNKHFITMPPINFNSNDNLLKLSRRKVWTMIKFARDHMKEGHFSLIWKDSTFSYAYFLWFENSTGSFIRPKHSSSKILPWEGYPVPGILCGDFYKRLLQECNPGNSNNNKIRCLELFCVHLGLVTSSCVLEHSKRLACSINDMTGTNFAADLL